MEQNKGYPENVQSIKGGTFIVVSTLSYKCRAVKTRQYKDFIDCDNMLKNTCHNEAEKAAMN